MIRFDQKFASKQVITELSAEHSSALLLIRPWKHMRLDATCWLFVEEGLLSVQKPLALVLSTLSNTKINYSKVYS